MTDLEARIRDHLNHIYEEPYYGGEKAADALHAVLDLLSYTEERVADEPYALSPGTVGVVAAGVRQAIARELGIRGTNE